MSKNKRKKKSAGTGLQGMELAKTKVGETVVHVGKELLIGTVLGAAAGAVTGRSSLLIGAVVTGMGHYHGNAGWSMFGAGMMASGGYQTTQGLLNGSDPNKSEMENQVEGVKERLSVFKDGFMKRLWLDKIVKSKKTEVKKPVSGLGEVQYFSYPDEKPVGELDMSGLDAIEAQLHQSAADFSNRQDAAQTYGTDEVSAGDTPEEAEERIY